MYNLFIKTVWDYNKITWDLVQRILLYLPLVKNLQKCFYKAYTVKIKLKSENKCIYVFNKKYHKKSNGFLIKDIEGIIRELYTVSVPALLESKKNVAGIPRYYTQ